jgi:hypothetical protein
MNIGDSRGMFGGTEKLELGVTGKTDGDSESKAGVSRDNEVKVESDGDSIDWGPKMKATRIIRHGSR